MNQILIIPNTKDEDIGNIFKNPINTEYKEIPLANDFMSLNKDDHVFIKYELFEVVQQTIDITLGICKLVLKRIA